ncbi:MAG: hypothetical protein AAGF75_14330, partial [Cyanobacteria bacterium P01_H01_bin.130]
SAVQVRLPASFKPIRFKGFSDSLFVEILFLSIPGLGMDWIALTYTYSYGISLTGPGVGRAWFLGAEREYGIRLRVPSTPETVSESSLSLILYSR